MRREEVQMQPFWLIPDEDVTTLEKIIYGTQILEILLFEMNKALH